MLMETEKSTMTSPNRIALKLLKSIQFDTKTQPGFPSSTLYHSDDDTAMVALFVCTSDG